MGVASILTRKREIPHLFYYPCHQPPSCNCVGLPGNGGFCFE